MRKYIFWTLLLLFAGGLLSVISQSEQGYVLFSLGTTTVETTIWFAAIALVLCAVVIWFIVRFIYLLFGYPDKVATVVRNISDGSKKHSAELMLLSHISGDYAKSEKYAVRFNDEQLSSALGRLVRIEAQIRQGKLGQAASELKRAIQSSDRKTKPAFLCLKMQLALEQENYKEIPDIFRELPSSMRNKMRWQIIYWQALIFLDDIKTLVTQLPSPYSYSGEEQERISELYKQALLQLVNADTDESRTTIIWYWKQLPAKMQRQRFYAEIYLQSLICKEDYAAAEKQLCQFARLPELGALMQYWGDFPVPKAHNSLKHLEKIYADGEDQWIGLGLGRLCLQLQLWGKAESYMRTTLEHHTDSELNNILLITLAKLYHQQGDNDKATNCLDKIDTVRALPKF